MTGVTLLDIEYALYGREGKVKIYDCFKQVKNSDGKMEHVCLFDGDMAETPIPARVLTKEVVLMYVGNNGDFVICVG